LDAQLKNKKGFDSKTDEAILYYKKELSERDDQINAERAKANKILIKLNETNVIVHVFFSFRDW